MFATGILLAQHRLADTDSTKVFTASMPTEITRMQIVNTSLGDTSISIYHNPKANAGNTPDNDNIVSLLNVGASETAEWAIPSAGAGLQLTDGDEIWVGASVASAVTVSIYGVTISIAPENL